MKLIAGLGNPGAEYARTRHNVGFRVVELLAGQRGIPINRYLLRTLYGRGRLGREEVILAKPLTYMNRSGYAIAALLWHFGLGPEDLLVVYDDVALPLGRLRLRGRGSAGGHKGIASIIDRLGTEEFPRLRLGVGAPPPGMALPDYVLSPFPPTEDEEVEGLLERAAQAVELFVTLGLEAAMNRINAPAPGKAGENGGPLGKEGSEFS
ncbi:MAG: aminoacyl-tRNA hydrolase [bacterium]